MNYSLPPLDFAKRGGRQHYRVWSLLKANHFGLVAPRQLVCLNDDAVIGQCVALEVTDEVLGLDDHSSIYVYRVRPNGRLLESSA